MKYIAPILTALVLSLPAVGQQPEQTQDFPLGTVFVTRNFDERLNSSPGYYNHNAIYVGNGWIVESIEGIGVVRSPAVDLWRRGYSHVVVLKPRDWLCGACAARRAEWLVGRPYGKFSSLWPFYGPLRLRLGLNCVSVVEFSYGVSGLNFPDDVFRCQGLLFLPAEAA